MEEGTLAACIDGQASKEALEHLANCPHCAAQVEAHRHTTAIVRAVLHRFSCPAPGELGLYQLLLLPSSEQLIVAKHVRECPHCQRELVELAQTDGQPSLLKRIREAVNVIEAELVPIPWQTVSAFRGTSTFSQRFRAAELDLHISVQSGHSRGRRTLIGRLLPHDTTISPSPGAEIWLIQDEQAWAAAVEAEGVFAYEDVTPGTYALSLEWEGQVVVVKEIVVN